MNKRIACADYISYMEAFRVYMEDKPEATIAYDDDIDEIRDWAERYDYELTITA